MNFSKCKINKLLFILLMLIIIISFIFSYSIGLGNDEFFTIGLIKHSYTSLINIDALDVHPPLYYLVLKLFIQITTFWTNSIIIKVLFARLLSLIFFGITFVVLVKTLNLFNIKVPLFVILVIYFAYSTISYYSITIRMYQMDVMLLVIEIYGLLLFKSRHKYFNRYYLIILLSISLSFYTNYFSALFASSFLLLNFIECLYHSNIRQALRILSIGIFDLILFIPCVKFTLEQIRYVSHSGYSNFVGTSNIGRSIYSQLLGAFTGKSVSNVKDIIISIIILLFEILIIFTLSRKVNKKVQIFVFQLYIAYIIGFIPSIILSFITHPMIQWRYGVPLFNIIFFFLVSIFIKWSITYKYNHIIYTVILILLLLFNVKTCLSNIHTNYENIISIQQVNKFSKSKSNTIILDTKNSNQILRPLYYSIYLPNYCHKDIIVKHMSIKNILASNNVELIHKTFNNLHLVGSPGKVYK